MGGDTGQGTIVQIESLFDRLSRRTKISHVFLQSRIPRPGVATPEGVGVGQWEKVEECRKSIWKLTGTKRRGTIIVKHHHPTLLWKEGGRGDGPGEEHPRGSQKGMLRKKKKRLLGRSGIVCLRSTMTEEGRLNEKKIVGTKRLEGCRIGKTGRKELSETEKGAGFDSAGGKDESA